MDNSKKNLSFGAALFALESGFRVTRSGWNGNQIGKHLFITLQITDENSKMTEPYFYMTIKEKDSVKRVPMPFSNVDILAHDWEVVE